MKMFMALLTKNQEIGSNLSMKIFMALLTKKKKKQEIGSDLLMKIFMALLIKMAVLIKNQQEIGSNY